MRVSSMRGFSVQLLQAAKRQARAQASLGRGLAPDPGMARNLHKRKGGGARRSDFYGDWRTPAPLPHAHALIAP